MATAGVGGQDERMSRSGKFAALHGRLRSLYVNWPALLLPLATVGALAVFRLLLGGGPDQISGAGPVSLAVVVASLVALLAPELGARIAPFAVLAFGVLGLFLVHFLRVAYVRGQFYYGPVHVVVDAMTYRITSSAEWSSVFGGFSGTVHQVAPGVWYAWWSNGRLGLVLAEAVACIIAGVWLLARADGPGAEAVRRAVGQLRGTGGQPKTVPPLLLLPVLFLGEELFGEHLWFGRQGGLGFAYWPLVIAVLLLAAAAAAVRWTPRPAAIAAVLGMAAIGICGLPPAHMVTDGPLAPCYGAVLLDGGISTLFAGAQGAALVIFACTLAPRLLAWDANVELAERARALTRRVDGLTRTRSDAAETAVAELRRIERDLHDGAQARLVAVGMSLRAVEQLIGSNPDAARALVGQAREMSSRALADLRDLVRGIYPPVLADRGLADAVRTLALDSVLPVEATIELSGEPPMPVAAAVYFAVAEALANAARHAGARAALVSVEHGGGVLRATVTDDGGGGADPARGTGLAGMERRLATFDGILAVSSPVGGPTIIVIEVPCALSSEKISSC